MKTYYVYILGNNSESSLYIGVTNNLDRRMFEHIDMLTDGFTTRYKCTKLLYYEDTPSIDAAIAREKQLKKWGRDKKERLIDTLNPSRIDLSTEPAPAKAGGRDSTEGF